jgi:hypothetical protein
MGAGTKRGNIDEMGDDGGESEAWTKITMGLRGQNMGGSEAGIWGGGLRGQNMGAQRPK